MSNTGTSGESKRARSEHASDGAAGANARVVNGTPHDVHVHLPGGRIVTYAKQSGDPTVRMTAAPQTPVGRLDDNVPIVQSQTFTGVEGMPAPAEGQGPILVSMVVGDYLRKQGFAGRLVVGPDSSPEGSVRDSGGRITGTRRLVYYTGPTDALSAKFVE